MKLIYPDYHNSILNVTNSILKHYGVPVSYDTIDELDTILQDSYNHIIYVLLDGLGTNVIRHHLQDTDGLRTYLHKEITSVFPPTTVAATDAVLSGLPPIVNGHLGWVQYFKEEDTNIVVFLNQDFYTGVKPETDLREKYLSFTKIYDLIQQHSPSVQTNEYFPSFREGGSLSFAQEIERVLLSTHNCDQSFNYVYWVEPDLTQHAHGIYSKEVGDVIRNLNTDFEQLIANVTDDTLVVLIADHGLTDVQQIPLFDYKDVTSLFTQKPSLEPRATTFFIEEGKHKEFIERFNHHFSSDFKLYTTEDFLATKLFGEGQMHPHIAQCFGDFISIATSNKMFGLHEGKGYKAHHAGMSADEMMVPLVLYSKKIQK